VLSGSVLIEVKYSFIGSPSRTHLHLDISGVSFVLDAKEACVVCIFALRHKLLYGFLESTAAVCCVLSLVNPISNKLRIVLMFSDFA